MVCVAVYFCVSTPVRLMLHYRCRADTRQDCLSQWDWSLLVDYVGDVLVVTDFVLRCYCFSFYCREGERRVIETDPTVIIEKFRRTSRFYTCIAVIVPFDFIAIPYGYLVCLRLPKLLSLGFVLPGIREVVVWLESAKNYVVDADAVLVLHLGLFTLLVSVWTTVGWNLLHYSGRSSEAAAALYWCFTSMTTTGYGDIVSASNDETLFNLAVCIIGPLVFTTIVAKFASLMKS